MASTIDYNQIAASIYNTIKSLNSTATSLVGLQCMWCRLLPYANSEDVIVQEYTLHQYECPKEFKIVCTKTDYSVGNYTIDLWGMHLEVPMEINIDLDTWNGIYGEGTMPQKGDFVLIPLIHKAFEVKSSVIIYTVGEQPTAYKCLLGQWQHNANRKESEDFTVSIDELTDSLDRLFGDAISKEVADGVNSVETAYNTDTYVDPVKDYDIDAITLDNLIAINGNVFSDAYYDFSKSTKNITYKVSATYDPTAKENHWIYSCWFKNDIDESSIKTAALKIIKLYLKEKDYWRFEIQPDFEVEEGEEVTIYRGGTIRLTGVIEYADCGSGIIIRIKASDCLKASAKVTNWWIGGNWKIQKYQSYNLLTLYNGEDQVIKVNYDTNKLSFNYGDLQKTISITSLGQSKYKYWNYFVMDLGPTKTTFKIIRNRLNDTTGKYNEKILLDDNININIKTFLFDSACIEALGSNMCLTNMRLYENEYELGDTYNIDMYSKLTRNASKLIFVDPVSGANKMSFISPLK